MRARLLATAVAAGLAAAVTGCSTSPGASAAPSGTLRLGYFANVTHAAALAGVERGTIAARLGPTKLDTQVFNAGPAAIEALFAGSIDAAYLGPNPTINAFVRSRGRGLRIVAGATSGGAQLVVQPDLPATAAGDLRGRTIATPQLGNTQDVALRAWLAAAGLKTDPLKGGDVTIAPTENATTFQLFKDRRIDGAWVPEPWASRLVLEGGGRVLVDERDLWPRREFVTTHLVVTTAFLDKHPDVVRRLVEAHVESTAWITANLSAAKTTVNTALEKLTQKKLNTAVIDRAFAHLTVTNDPVATSLATSAAHAVAAGLTKAADLHGIYDLRILNLVLARAGQAPVTDAGLGV